MTCDVTRGCIGLVFVLSDSSDEFFIEARWLRGGRVKTQSKAVFICDAITNEDEAQGAGGEQRRVREFSVSGAGAGSVLGRAAT